MCFVVSDRKCNPSLLSLVSNVSTTEPSGDSSPGHLQWWDAQSIVGLVIFLFCTLYARSLLSLTVHHHKSGYGSLDYIV